MRAVVYNAMTKGGIRDDRAESSIDPTILYRTTWDGDPESTPVHAIVTAVADATDTDPQDLPPLYDVVDPDALNSLFARPATTVRRVRLEYAGHEVVVRGSGEVHVHPVDDS